MAVTDLEFGGLHGPIVHTDKDVDEDLIYGGLYGPIVGVEDSGSSAPDVYLLSNKPVLHGVGRGIFGGVS